VMTYCGGLAIALWPPFFLKTMRKILKSKNETIKFGTALAKKLKGGDVLCLYGDLGAGKTTLVKGIAKGLGIKKTISSPTFALMNIFPVKSRVAGTSDKPKLFNRVNPAKSLKLIHIDTYRLKDKQELLDIGAEDYQGAADAICVIEWPEKIKGLLKKKKIVKVTMEHLEKNRRKVTI